MLGQNQQNQNHKITNFVDKCKRLPIFSSVLRACGLMTASASIMGSYQYLMLETENNLMSLAMSTGTAVAIYAAWEVSFYSKKINRSKRLLAALFAISASMLTSYTIYEYAAHIEYQAQQSIYNAQNKEAALAQQNRIKSLQDIKLAVDNSAKAIQNTIDALNTKIKSLESGAKPGEIAVLNVQISKAQAALSEKLNKSLELSNQIESATPVHKPLEQNNTFNIPRAARSLMFELLTFVFVLFANTFRAARAAKELEIAVSLDRVTNEAVATFWQLVETKDDVTTATTLAAQAKHDLTETVNEAATATTRIQVQLDDVTTATTLAAQAKHDLTETVNEAATATTQLQEQVNDANNVLKTSAKTKNELVSALTELKTYMTRHVQLPSPSAGCQPASENIKYSADDVLNLIKIKAIPLNANKKITIRYLEDMLNISERTAKKAYIKSKEAGLLVDTGHGCMYPPDQEIGATSNTSNISFFPVKKG